MGGPRPPAGREDAEGATPVPYRYENSRGQTYYLHGKEVTLQNGRRQQIYYFAREPKAGEALDALPPGRAVIENPRTGLPFLKGTGAAPTAAPAAPATRTASKGTAATGAQRTATRR
jgi:hypothetical protein